MRQFIIISSLATLTGVLAAAPPTSPIGVQAPAEFAAVREFIRDSVERGQAPSIAVGVIRDGTLVWSEAFGLADRERRIAATPDTIYWLASVSKPISATGLMQLVERGVIDLDQPANKYLGDSKLRAYVGSANDMTIRRLANHSAGLPIHNNFFYGTSPPSMDETIRRYGFASLEPGKQVQYSNLAYGILGYIVERATGMPWREYQEKRVYDPLKMTRTSDRIRPGFERDAAVPYVTDAAGRFVPWPRYDFDHRPASSNYSTVNDLSRFVRMHMNGGELEGVRILKPESVKEMQRVTGETRPGSGYGVAWQSINFGGHPGITHSGGMPGVVTLINLFPADRAATIVLSNGDNRGLIPQITRRLGQVLYKDVPDLPSAPPPAAASSRSEGSARQATSSTALAGVWRGRLVHYDGDIPLTVTAKREGAIDVGFGTRNPVFLKDPVLTDSSLAGHIEVNLHTQDGYRGMPDLRFALMLRDGKLTGVASAFVPNYFTLPFWIELERVAEPQAIVQPRSEQQPPGGTSGSRWFKGNTHTHTNASDGDSSAADVVQTYRDMKYDFLVLTDHLGVTPIEGLVPADATPMLLIHGQEVTDQLTRTTQLHVTAMNLRTKLLPAGGGSVAEILQKDVDAIRAAGATPIINHPNFTWAITASDLKALKSVKFFELHNAHPQCNSFGGGGSPSVEEMWDAVLSSGQVMYGVGSDDMHELKRPWNQSSPRPGTAYIMVRANALTPDEILAAMDRGDFYASTGVDLTDYVVTPKSISLTIRELSMRKYRVQFIGKGGKLLKEVPATSASYDITGSEGYVRVKVIESGGRYLWTQPVFTSPAG
jgi:CubicO group peptidase (beta-lactamase class C family)